MLTAKGEAVQWAEVLYNKPVLVQRGSFRPVTKATLDVLERGFEQFVREPELQGQTPVVVMEMTLRHLTTGEIRPMTARAILRLKALTALRLFFGVDAVPLRFGLQGRHRAARAERAENGYPDQC